jgi:hypothetical protein
MFGEEKAEWDKFYDFYKAKFGEEVGLMLSVFQNDDFEIDFVIGEDSGEIHGVRIMQMVPYTDDEEEEDDEELAEIETDEEDDSDEEDDDEMMEMIQYDFVKTAISKAEIKGEPLFQLEFGEKPQESEEGASTKEKNSPESEVEDNRDPFKMVMYALKKDDEEDHELTGVMMINNKNPDEITVFVEHPELEE